jgi:hypothetical protein
MVEEYTFSACFLQAVAFALLEESGIAKGIRRVVATTGSNALAAREAAAEFSKRVEAVEALDDSLLQAEVDKMAAASEGGFNEFVVVPLGLVVGAAPVAVLNALGLYAPACIASASPSHLCGMVMKWEDGGTLHELLHDPSRAWGAGTAERLLMCAQLASGVAALHAAAARRRSSAPRRCESRCCRALAAFILLSSLRFAPALPA